MVINAQCWIIDFLVQKSRGVALIGQLRASQTAKVDKSSSMSMGVVKSVSNKQVTVETSNVDHIVEKEIVESEVLWAFL